VRVVHERTCGGRLFQTVGVAARKAREPNDKLDRVTNRTFYFLTLHKAHHHQANSLGLHRTALYQRCL